MCCARGSAAIQSGPGQVLRLHMDLSGNGLLWYARPELFFRCTVCPTGSLQTPSKHKDSELALVFFSTFEPITLTPGAVTQRNGVPMLYDTASSSNLPSLYLCLARNAISDTRRRAADTMMRRREERGEDYYRKPAAGDGAASD